jgi:hypothetical protein
MIIMKKIFAFLLFSLIFISCKKNDAPTEKQVDEILPNNCNITQAYAANAQKQTISNGVWGTVSFMQGNCMPTFDPTTTTCKHCPVKRTVKIYNYTLRSNAVPSGNSTVFFESFNTTLIAQVDTDAEGFYQVNIPAGRYTIAVVENGKLYANGGDGQGGINPFTIVSNNPQKANLVMSYKAYW